jgi:hypothetical protein
MKFVVEVIPIGGGLSGFLGTYCSGSVFPASLVSVSMSVVVVGAIKLRVNTAFGGILTSADVGTGLANFWAVYEVSCVFYSPEIVILGR